MTDNRHLVTDAHGRSTDFTTNAPVTGCQCGGRGPLPKSRHWAKAAVAIAAILTAGLVVSVLLLTIRDIVVAVAGSSATGFLLKILFASSDRRDR
ncbi:MULTISPECIES: hypothetical protein [Streptomyces]|uniref:hypothetical protein n=1 Tax=Streptomyces TaxID=1883 RepID=UPI0008CCF8F1|nr:hypothetical protein [Streptomyces sp. yr375]SES31695.1 hypothetical protein SAMN04487983_104246 [Streptomyces sp. yr375]